MLPSPRKACHVRLALLGRASTGPCLVLAYHTLFVWLGLRPIVIIRFRARGLRAIDITRLKLRQSVFLASSVTACCFAIQLAQLITDIKSVLSQKSLDMFCQNFHIPNKVHPQLPSPNQTIHEIPTEMDLLSFIRIVDPTKVRIGERQRAEGEPKLLDITVGRVVPLLPVARARTEGKLEASVDKLFDEGGSGNQTEQCDSAIAGKRLLAGAVLNVEVRGDPIPTLPFVTYSVSATPEREGGRHTDSLAGANLQTVSVPQRFVISSDSSYHSGTHVAETEVDSLIRSSTPAMTTVTTVTATVDAATVVKEAHVKPSLFAAGSSSAGGTDPTPSGFSDLTVYVPQWSVTNGSRLNGGRICREMVDEFAPPIFFASIRGMEHDQLFTEFNVRAACQISLSTEVRMRAEYNIRENRRLKSVVDEQAELLKVREKEIEDLKTQLLLTEAEAAEAIRLLDKASKFEVVEKSLRNEAQVLKERNTTLEREKGELEVKVADLAASVKVREQELADLDVVVTSVRSQNDNLVDQVHGLEISSTRLQEKVIVYENYMGQLEIFQDERIKVVNDKFDKLYTDFVEMSLHLEERFYLHLLTTISGRRWLLTHGMELSIAKCLNSTEYLSTLRATIGKAVEKGMQDGLSAEITHDAEGRALTDVATYNPSAEADYLSSLQHTLAERLGLTGLQPHVDQLMVPIHHSSDQRVIGASALSLSLDVSSSRPLSITDLTSTKGTSNVIPATADTTTALSVTFTSLSSIPPISTDDYEVVHADGREGAGADANPFPNVDDAELNIS
ncbi:hypothetical protein Tco_1237466 [Tanacetum coccineum]